MSRHLFGWSVAHQTQTVRVGGCLLELEVRKGVRYGRNDDGCELQRPALEELKEPRAVHVGESI